MNPEHSHNPIESKENIETVLKVLTGALERSYAVHQSLGESGKDSVQKNQFDDTALRIDIEAENAIFDHLKENNVPIRVISEEHGTVDIGDPRLLGILDGLDGSGVAKEHWETGRYGTMFGILNNTDPTYNDYLASGVFEHTTGKLFFASKGHGAFVKQNGVITPIHNSGRKILDTDTDIRIDEYFDINKQTFSDKLKDYKTHCGGSSCIYYIDVASGAADLALECTRKGNLEIAIAYGLITEAGGVMVDLDGTSLGDKKYLEYGQKDKLPVITAATPELAQELIAHIKK